MIYCGNCIEQMKSLKSGSVNLIFADPPYFLSNGGLSINSGKVVSVNKGEWDKKENYDDVRKFTYDWLKECNRLLMDDGSMWISCTHHNLYDLKSLMTAKFRGTFRRRRPCGHCLRPAAPRPRRSARRTEFRSGRRP